ncbi:hypothetical protein M011DRAFT_222521 [Sporormia fimetaria CBS 119925]|uniref:Uncharacterized protein n=1 Tax=Sporormia fimetaria CBS 119925 TaxID=1340428 RepID=A0A6A6V1I3_9PLEO|nr:hypothetical protein M011DRAFT_222521 [Sporormia fimetaria CBS 119925]
MTASLEFLSSFSPRFGGWNLLVNKEYQLFFRVSEDCNHDCSTEGMLEGRRGVSWTARILERYSPATQHRHERHDRIGFFRFRRGIVPRWSRCGPEDLDKVDLKAPSLPRHPHANSPTYNLHLRCRAFVASRRVVCHFIHYSRGFSLLYDIPKRDTPAVQPP